jgi:hypothetical protein
MIIVLTILAVARVTRFITTDALFDGPRRWVISRLMPTGGESAWRNKIAYLIVCDWCSSVYVGVGAAGAYWTWGETMPYMMTCLALAASYATGLLASLTNGGD